MESKIHGYMETWTVGTWGPGDLGTWGQGPAERCLGRSTEQLTGGAAHTAMYMYILAMYMYILAMYTSSMSTSSMSSTYCTHLAHPTPSPLHWEQQTSLQQVTTLPLPSNLHSGL